MSFQLIFQPQENKQSLKQSSCESSIDAASNHSDAQEETHQSKAFRNDTPEQTSEGVYWKQKLLQQGFTWAMFFEKKLCSYILESNGESMRVELKLGHYRTCIKVLRDCGTLEKMDKKDVGSGKFGSVYHIRGTVQNFVCKSIKIDPFQQQSLMKVYSELFFVKMASALQVGPKYIDIMGYDLILNNETADFCFSLCEVEIQKIFSSEFLTKNLTEQECLKSFNERLTIEMKQNLKLLHSFSLIHGDIKPQNIAWDPLQKKFVFIDFGLSQLLNERPGQKTLSGYFGTYHYAGAYMKKLYFFRGLSYIDLFENDEECLNATLNQVKLFAIPQLPQFNEKTISLREKDEIKDQSLLILNDNIINLFKMRSLLFQLNYHFSSFQQLIRHNPLKNAINSLLKMARIKGYEKDSIALEQLVQQLRSSNLPTVHGAQLQKIDQQLAHLIMSKLTNNQFTIQQICLPKGRRIIEQYWGQPIFMENLLNLIIKDKNNAQDKRRLVKVLAKYEKIDNKQTYLGMLVQLLVHFMDYFTDLKHIKILKELAGVFLELNLRNLFRQALYRVVRLQQESSRLDMFIFLIECLFIQIIFCHCVFDPREIAALIQQTSPSSSIEKQAGDICISIIETEAQFREKHNICTYHQSRIKIHAKNLLKLDSQIRSPFINEIIKNNMQDLSVQESCVINSPIQSLRLFKSLRTGISHLHSKDLIRKKISKSPFLAHTESYWTICIEKRQIGIEVAKFYLTYMSEYPWTTLGDAIDLLLLIFQLNAMNETIQSVQKLLNSLTVVNFQKIKHILNKTLLSYQIYGIIVYVIRIKVPQHQQFLDQVRQILEKIMNSEQKHSLTSYEASYFRFSILLINNFQDQVRLLQLMREDLINEEAQGMYQEALMLSNLDFLFSPQNIKKLNEIFYQAWIDKMKQDFFTNNRLFHIKLFQPILNCLLVRHLNTDAFNLLVKITKNEYERGFVAMGKHIDRLYIQYAKHLEQSFANAQKIKNLTLQLTMGQVGTFPLLSRLVFKLFLVLESGSLLTNQDKKRLINLIAIGLPGIQHSAKKYHIKLLQVSQRILKGFSTKRKKLICLKRQSKITEAQGSWKKQFLRQAFLSKTYKNFDIFDSRIVNKLEQYCASIRNNRQNKQLLII